MYAAAGNAIRQARKQGGKKAVTAGPAGARHHPGQGLLAVHSAGDNVSVRNFKASSAEGKFAASAAATTPGATGERRPSVSDVAAFQHRTKASKAHKRWVKKNRIRDASCGDDEDGFGVEGSGANVVLYVGLGLVCVGLVISFVGLGEKGFKTAELRLIGPSLLAAGALFCLLRVLFCTCPAVCCCCCPEERRRRKRSKKRRRKLRGEPVSSSDDEIIITKQPKAGGVKPSTSLVVNGEKHVVIPIKRQPPTPTPPSPSMLRVQHNTTVVNIPPETVTLPNYICDNDDLGKINPDPDAHVIEHATTSKAFSLKPPPSTSQTLSPQSINKLQRPREKSELVLNAAMLQNV